MFFTVVPVPQSISKGAGKSYEKLFKSNVHRSYARLYIEPCTYTYYINNETVFTYLHFLNSSWTYICDIQQAVQQYLKPTGVLSTQYSKEYSLLLGQRANKRHSTHLRFGFKQRKKMCAPWLKGYSAAFADVTRTVDRYLDKACCVLLAVIWA